MNDEQMQNLAKHTANVIDEIFGKPHTTQQVQESLPTEECPSCSNRCENYIDNGDEITWDNYRGK